MEGWKTYYDGGLAYCTTVLGAKANGKEDKFGTSVMYNLMGLAIENLLTGLIMKDDQLPEHSGIGSMLELLKVKYNVPVSFKEEGRFFNKFMNYFCTLEVMPRVDPTTEDIDRMLLFLVNVRDWVVEKTGITSPAS